MAKGFLKIATCQFAVSRHIGRNAAQICKFLRRAAKARAHIVHLPECALSGYAVRDFDTFKGFDWELLKKQTEQIMALAGELRLWVVLGSTHRLTVPNKPHNCLYLINQGGRIIDRYDKRFCTTEDLEYYSPGNHFVHFNVKGVKCSLLICFDARFPELYRELYKQKVKCIFQSFYNARQEGPSVHTHIMRQTMQCRAATNHFWVSMANSSGYYSPYPSCFFRPDGLIAKSLKQNRPGIMFNTVNLKEQFYDPMAGFRDMAVGGKLSSALEAIKDARSRRRTVL